MVVKNTDLGRGHIRTLCWPAVRRLRVSFGSRSSPLASTTAFLHRPQKGVSGGPPCQPTCYRYLREKCSPDRNHAATTQRALGIDGIVPRFEPANDPEQSLRRRLVRSDSVSINGAALAGERTGQGRGVVRRAMPCKGPWHLWHSWQSWQCRICKLQILKGVREFKSHSLRHIRINNLQEISQFDAAVVTKTHVQWTLRDHGDTASANGEGTIMGPLRLQRARTPRA